MLAANRTPRRGDTLPSVTASCNRAAAPVCQSDSKPTGCASANGDSAAARVAVWCSTGPTETVARIGSSAGSAAAARVESASVSATESSTTSGFGPNRHTKAGSNEKRSIRTRETSDAIGSESLPAPNQRKPS